MGGKVEGTACLLQAGSQAFGQWPVRRGRARDHGAAGADGDMQADGLRRSIHCQGVEREAVGEGRRSPVEDGQHDLFVEVARQGLGVELGGSGRRGCRQADQHCEDGHGAPTSDSVPWLA